MITLCKVNETFISGKFRILKVQQFGAKTANECSPFGEDSNPLKNMTAIFAKTSEAGSSVIIGYINENQLANLGEKRIFSLKETGELSSYIWLKNDKTIEINGNNDNLVRFLPLNKALFNLDSNINAELSKISAAIASLGGTYVNSVVKTDINDAKIEEIKTL